MSKPDTMDTPKIMCITVSKVKQSLGISIGGGRVSRLYLEYGIEFVLCRVIVATWVSLCGR